MCELSEADYARAFERVNLIDRWSGKNGKGDAFPISAARLKAAKVLAAVRSGTRIVVLGRAVARAFDVGLEQAPLMRWTKINGVEIAVLPHPSGVNLWYNDARNRVCARRFMRSILA